MPSIRYGFPKPVVLGVLALLISVMTAFAGIPSAPPAQEAMDDGFGMNSILPSPTLATTDTQNEKPLPISTMAPSRTPTFAPGAWQDLPVIPVVSDTARRIYRVGRVLGNNPHDFSILGDCLSLPDSMLGNYGKNPRHYNLGEYAYLQPVIDWFVGSFDRNNIAAVSGFNSASVLSPLRADPEQCKANESPMVCEYNVHFPSYAIISLGTDDDRTPPPTYELMMREIIEYTLSKGIVPILATKADNREGNHEFNRIVARLAYEYDIPIWNFWAAVQSLPRQGLADDQGHLTRASPNHFEYPNSMQFAMPVRALTALQALDAVWRGVTAP